MISRSAIYIRSPKISLIVGHCHMKYKQSDVLIVSLVDSIFLM